MTILAHDIMTPNVKAVPESWTMDHLARFLTENEITGSPVTNGAGDIVGIVTLKDIAEFRWCEDRKSDAWSRLTTEEQEEARRLRVAMMEQMSRLPVEVRDIMTPQVLSVDEATPMRDIADIMMAEHVHRIFVTRAERITGIITTYDMLKVIADKALSRRFADGD